MGFGDKLKDLKKQAQGAVADHRGQIEDAVGVVGMAVDKKTKGRHSQRIAKFGQKATEAVDKFGGEEPRDTSADGAPATPPTSATTESTAPKADEPAPGS